MAVRRARVGKKKHAWVKWVVALGVVVFLGLVFAASVGVGNWMLTQAEQYPAGEEQQSVQVPEQEIVAVGVSPIKASKYRLGARYYSYLNSGVRHLCAPLRDAQGVLAFSSEVCSHAGWDQNGSVNLETNAWELHQNGMYLCTYIEITGFAEENRAVSELVLSYEASLIAEAAASGVDEIFLTGISPTQANVTEIAQYVRRVKALAGDCAIGVMITPDVLLAAEYEVYMAAQLLSVCDFLVLDLREVPLKQAPESETGAEGEEATEMQPLEETGKRKMTVTYLMEHMQYDLVRYFPRLALTEQQSDALDYIISKGYGNWVIIE